MIEPTEIEDRAFLEAESILAYFKNVEKLGAFAGEDVTEQKSAFLKMALVNFARRETDFHSLGKAETGTPSG